MPKKILKITDFRGGVNSYSDARDIDDTEFAQNWNAALDKTGIVRYTGGGQQSITNLPHGNANFQGGYGLFHIGVGEGQVIDGDFVNAFEEGTLQTLYSDGDSTEILNNTGNFSSNWAVSGDFAVDSTDATFTHSSGTGTLAQTSFSHAGTVSTLHAFVYTVSNKAFTTLTLEGASGDNHFASEDISIPTAVGTHTVLFKAHTTLTKFQLTATRSSATGGVSNIDDVSLKQVNAVHLAATSTYQSAANHETDDFYNNYAIVIYSGTGIGQTRRISDYTGATKVALLDATFGTNPNASSKYKIFRWVGDGTQFGDQGNDDYIDKSGPDFPFEDIEFSGQEDYYFLRTKSAAVTNNQSKPLGFITFNPSTSATFAAVNLTASGDSHDTVIGATTLNAGISYVLSFYCSSVYRYYGHVSNGVEAGTGTSYGERVPFVQLYSDSVTDGTNNGLYLFQGESGTQFMTGATAEATYDYAANIVHNYIDNGDFEAGTATGGTDDGPTEWTRAGTTFTCSYATPSFTDATCDTTNTDATVTCDSSSLIHVGQVVAGSGIDAGTTVASINTGTDGTNVTSFELSAAATATASNVTLTFTETIFGAEGNTLNIGATGGFGINGVGMPNARIQQDITLQDNQWYQLFFAYSSSAGGVTYAVKDQTSNLFITDFTLLPNTGSMTTYRYIGQTEAEDGAINKPIAHRFFVPDNNGTPRTIRIFLSPVSASSNVRFDGISVHKSFPDLLSMNSENGTTSGNPYSEDMKSWKRYQTTFRIPVEYNNATDWVLRINGGTWGFQDGATGAYNTQTVYFAKVRIEGGEDNFIALNDNSSTSSKIMLYSSINNSWTENDLAWSGANAKPVYNYINGMLKISDANFLSGNRSLLYYYLDRKLLGGLQEIKGYEIRTFPLSLPPNILADSASDSQTVGQVFDALNYANTYTFVSEYQRLIQSSDGSTTEDTNWPLDKLEGHGRIMYYKASSTFPNNATFLPYCLYHNTDGTTAEASSQGQFHGLPWFNDSGAYSLSFGGSEVVTVADGHINPFYIAWAGSDGTSNDMGSAMSTYTTGDVAGISFEFTYYWQAAKRPDSGASGSANKIWETMHPQFEIKAGKLTSGIFNGSAISDANQKLLGQGHASVITMGNSRTATLYDGDDVWTGTEDENHSNRNWLTSSEWPWTTDAIDDQMYYGSKTLRAEISFNENDVAYTDDMILQFKVVYPQRGDYTFKQCLQRFDSNDGYNHGPLALPFCERVAFSNIDVKFLNNAWSSTSDGVTSANIEDTKVTFGFATPSEEIAVGWEDRQFEIGVTSVNIFDEESNIRTCGTIIGSGTSTGVVTNVSSITAGQCPTVSIYIGDSIAKDKYRKKLKYYMKDNDSNIWYLQFYVDLDENKAYATTSNFSIVGINDTANLCYSYTIPKEKMLNYNEIDSYEAETLISQDIAEKSIENFICDYKTSTTLNNRLYVGNVRQNGKIYGDRMIKSPIGKYNLLPITNFIDVEIHDGDEITALEYYKDKLLQFKKRKVFVISTSGDYEFLEDTFDNIGVAQPCQVIRTPYGVVWANSSGCYLYDGQELKNLIDNKIGTEAFQSAIVNNYWAITDSQIPSVGYVKSTKKILVQKDVLSSSFAINAAPTIFQYDFVTQGWTFLFRKQTPDTGNSTVFLSNFCNDENGDVLFYEKGKNNIYKWDDSPINNKSGVGPGTDSIDFFSFTTKDYDFGNPGVRKNIYKVYVTFKSVEDSTGSDVYQTSAIFVSHATNGGTTYTPFDDSSTNYDASNGLNGSGTDWITAELKPTSSISNVYSFQLEFKSSGGTIPNRFEINDIAIVYRIKHTR